LAIRRGLFFCNLKRGPTLIPRASTHGITFPFVTTGFRFRGVSYRVFARKYRPQRFEEVVGQEHITKTLQNAITGQRLAQAYLFVGPRGVGKTSSARILAKALNCQASKEGPTDNPCGTCDACMEIAEGRSLDVMEIDGASNNSVESIRTLRENAAYAPARGPYKVYLIDEVHMLSTAAFNALLKTLEEPPDHVKFLFATTEAQKVPATILSRCQRFDLRRLTAEQIAGHLLFIAGNEGIDLAPEAAQAIARGADGAMRDAESMLDQVVAFCGNTIGAADVHSVFGFTPRETVLELGHALVTRDTPSALAVVKAQAEAGKDLSRLLGDLIGLLRDVLILKVHPPQGTTEESVLGDAIQQEKLLLLLDHFGEAEGRLRWATDKKLQLDVALIKAVHLLEETTLSEVLDVLSSLRGGDPLPERTARRDDVSKPTSAPAKRVVPLGVTKPIPTASAGMLSPSTVEDPKPSPVLPSAVTPVTMEIPVPASPTEKPSGALGDDPWNTIATKLATDSPLKFGWVEDGSFLGREGNAVIVEFPPSLESHTQTLFWPQAVKKIEELLSTLLGERVAFTARFTGSEPPVAPESQEIVPSVTLSKNESAAKTPPDPTPKEKKEPAGPVMSPEELEAFKDDPLIKKALDLFKAEILASPIKPKTT
jgi:DNA polymerase III subunit gamma/tau